MLDGSSTPDRVDNRLDLGAAYFSGAGPLRTESVRGKIRPAEKKGAIVHESDCIFFMIVHRQDEYFNAFIEGIYRAINIEAINVRHVKVE